MSRKKLSDEQIQHMLTTTPVSESEGEDFETDSEEEYIPQIEDNESESDDDATINEEETFPGTVGRIRRGARGFRTGSSPLSRQSTHQVLGGSTEPNRKEGFLISPQIQQSGTGIADPNTS